MRRKHLAACGVLFSPKPTRTKLQLTGTLCQFSQGGTLGIFIEPQVHSHHRGLVFQPPKSFNSRRGTSRRAFAMPAETSAWRPPVPPTNIGAMSLGMARDTVSYSGNALVRWAAVRRFVRTYPAPRDDGP
jgi:hypothetical protein